MHLLTRTGSVELFLSLDGPSNEYNDGGDSDEQREHEDNHDSDILDVPCFHLD